MRAIRLISVGVLLLISTGRAIPHEPVTTRITFNREVVRILRQHCLDCHSAERIAHQLPLTTYAEARPWAKAIKEEVLNRRMTPFQAVRGFGLFHADYALPRHQQDQLIAWIEGGAPRGDEKDYPHGMIAKLNGPRDWAGQEPDLVLQPPRPVRIPTAPYRGIRCFSLPVGNREERWIRLAEFMPDNGQVVHHASLHIGRAGTGCRERQEHLVPLGEWVPGQRTIPAPAGMAHRLPPAATIVVKIDYQSAAAATTDRSLVGLHFETQPVEKSLATLRLRHAPSSQGGKLVIEHQMTEDQEIVAIRPLLHPAHSSLEARLIRPDGTSEILVFARDYRFDWQPGFHYRIPRPAPRGSTILITAWPVTNPPNQPVRAGSGNATLCELVVARTR